MTSFYFIPVILIGLTGVVFIHELGHFLAARALGVRVEAFALGWGKVLWSWKPHTTEYRLCLFPLGGYCKMAGEQYLLQALDPSQPVAAPEAGTIFAAAPWRRIVIALAGPLANVFLAWILLSSLHFFGYTEQVAPNKIVLASETSQDQTYPANQAGLNSGDLVLRINDQAVNSFSDLQKILTSLGGSRQTWLIQRQNQTLTMSLTPRWNAEQKRFLVGVSPWIEPVLTQVLAKTPAELAGLEVGDRILAVDHQSVPHTQLLWKLLQAKKSSFSLTVQRGDQRKDLTLVPDWQGQHRLTGLDEARVFVLPEVEIANQGFSKALELGSNDTTRLIQQMTLGLWELFTGKMDPAQSVSGPIGIISQGSQTTLEGFANGWSIGIVTLIRYLCVLSLALFMMNLLPIPVLDGGSIVLNLIEMLRRKPWSLKALIRYQQIGAVTVLLLLVYATFNDLSRLF